MIWTYIYEFFVKYIFGGRLYLDDYSTNTYAGGLGVYLDPDTNKFVNLHTGNYFIDFNNRGGDYYYSIGNYLSMITTIITMALIVFFAIWLVRWVFKAVASAFLLK